MTVSIIQNKENVLWNLISERKMINLLSDPVLTPAELKDCGGGGSILLPQQVEGEQWEVSRAQLYFCLDDGILQELLMPFV